MNENIKQLLDDFMDKGFEIAAERLHRDANCQKVCPAALGIGDAGDHNLLAMLPWEDDVDKKELLMELGSQCYNKEINKVALLVDAAMKQYETLPDIDTEFPLSYPPSMRQDCFILSYIDFKDPKENCFTICPYKVLDGKLHREPSIQFSKTVLSMSSNILSMISFGFTKSAMADKIDKKEIIGDNLNIEIGKAILAEVLTEFPGATLGVPPDPVSPEAS